MDTTTKTLLAATITAVVIAVWASPVLFNFAIHYIDQLIAKGKTARAYAFSQFLFRVATLPIIAKLCRPTPPALLFRLSQLATQHSSTQEALHLAQLAAHPEQEAGTRLMAMSYISALMRQQNRSIEAEKVDKEAISIQSQVDLAQSLAGINPDVSSALLQCYQLFYQGRLAQALHHTDTILRRSDRPTALALNRLRSIILKLLDRYDEAIACYDGIEHTLANFTSKTSAHSSYNTTIIEVTHKAYRDMYVNDVLSLVVLCLQAGRIGSAQEHWQKLFGKKTNNDTYSFYLAVNAWLCAATGSLEKAHTLIAECERLSLTRRLHTTTKVATGFAISQTCLALHDNVSAALKLKAIVALVHVPLYRAAYQNALADCYHRMENIEQANELYSKVIQSGFEEASFTKNAQKQLATIAVAG